MNFDKLVEDCRPVVLKYCLYLIKTDQHTAEDLTQQTLLKAINGRDSYNTALPLENWLIGIARNVYYDYIKSKGREQRLCLDTFQEEVIACAFQQDSGSPILDKIIKSEEVELLYKSIQELPERERQVVTLHAEGLTNPEIAQTLGITTENVAVTLHNARKKLRRVLDREADL